MGEFGKCAPIIVPPKICKIWWRFLLIINTRYRAVQTINSAWRSWHVGHIMNMTQRHAAWHAAGLVAVYNVERLKIVGHHIWRREKVLHYSHTNVEICTEQAKLSTINLLLYCVSIKRHRSHNLLGVLSVKEVRICRQLQKKFNRSSAVAQMAAQCRTTWIFSFEWWGYLSFTQCFTVISE